MFKFFKPSGIFLFVNLGLSLYSISLMFVIVVSFFGIFVGLFLCKNYPISLLTSKEWVLVPPVHHFITQIRQFSIYT